MTNTLLSRLLTAAICGVLLAHTSLAAEPPIKTLKSGIDRVNFDTSVKAGDNFFQHVNGTWLRHNPIPSEFSSWDAFTQLHDGNVLALKELLENLATPTEPLSADRRKLSDYFATAMDQARINEQGIKPMADEFDRIAKINTRDDLIALISHEHAIGAGPLFSFGVDQDERQSDRYAIHFWQGGMGLPEREYYLGAGEDSRRIREQYQEHVAKMLELLGDSPEAAKAGADTVLKLETRLAEASRTPVQLRDPEANYNKKTLAELAALTPSLDWNAYLNSLGASGVHDMIVGQPEFFQRVDELLASVPIADWQTYLRWQLIHHTAPYLNDAIEQENFRFFSTVMRGTKEMQPRWKRVIMVMDRQMGEALGQLYVEKYFTPDAKRRMDQLVQNLVAAYRERIESRDWMSEETKKQALAKLATVMPKIGYPAKWRDYSKLEIATDSYVQNALRAEAFEQRRQLAKLGQPVDRGEWSMSPPTVNAYYNPSLNEIVFPAGILQPPFFDAAADDAVNYGAIGAVIGHEITHGFDDQGSRYDAAGNLENWWTDADRARFNAKTDKLVKQYDACIAVDDTPVNGRLTLGENIADLGGVTIAYAAYQKSLGGKPAPVIDSFTGPQRFFIGFAQAWRGAVRDAYQRLLVRTNPHSPDRFRTLIPLSNVQGFYEAFEVQPGDAMYRPPEDRVEIW